MDEYQAEQLACEHAARHKPSYYTEPFRPHDWVVDAIHAAYEKGKRDGYDEGYKDGYDNYDDFWYADGDE